ncbi:MAG: YlbF family regulator [Lachnospiraceae bacterium]|nr:YlbF family regulator [Lachnospiraceae bacterium]MDE6981104.1 YlbF family regulator [Lachnospiraceae bacterium]
MERNETKTNDYSNHYGSIMDVFRRRKANADPVKAAIESLVSAIRQSETYHAYLEAKEEIMQMPVLKAQMDEFRKKNYELQNLTVNVLEETEKLQQEFASMLDNTLVRRYLNAENAFCRMIQQVNWQLIEELDFEADFIGKSLREAE